MKKEIENITLPFNLNEIREQFPILKQIVNGKPLVYLDNAATTQKPVSVIETLTKYYLEQNANIHRGVHKLSQIATSEYEKARLTIKNFLNASSEKEIIFVRNATEGINLVASSYGRKNINEGDEIIISAMEHHSNIVPWQILCEEKKASLKVIPMDDNGELIIDEFKKLVNEKTKFVSVVYISNSLGTVNPVKEIIDYAHGYNIPVMIDGAQAAHHIPVDVKELDCDFFVFSGHKIYGPTGSGALYGKQKFLEEMPPYMGGGDMIASVTFEKTIYNELPHKFEAGTPDIAAGIGLGAALDFVSRTGINNIAAHEKGLLEYAENKLASIPGLSIIGNAKNKSGVISFVLDGVHPHDTGTILDFEGIAIRTGHHCTQPVMKRFNIPATARVSFAVYNVKEEIDLLEKGIYKVIEVFK